MLSFSRGMRGSVGAASGRLPLTRGAGISPRADRTINQRRRQRAPRGLSLAFVGFVLSAPGCSRPKPLEKHGVPELMRMLSDPDPVVQAQGAFGLGKHGPEAAVAVPALIPLLSSGDMLVRQQVCGALGKIGAPAESAVPALLQVLDDPEWIIRQQALVAIGQIRPPLGEVEASLKKCERDPVPRVRKVAQETLASLR